MTRASAKQITLDFLNEPRSWKVSEDLLIDRHGNVVSTRCNFFDDKEKALNYAKDLSRLRPGKVRMWSSTSWLVDLNDT